ncbi:MAG: ROK family protein [Candidatus Woesebacteria bacterium]|nr:MAG: ROK family protein [Candidatus Woesebacteria bacterium]
MSTNLFFDIGASKTRIGVSSDLSSITDQDAFDTPKNFDEAMNLISVRAKNLLNEIKSERAIVGLAGPMDKDHDRLLKSNLADWVNKPIKKTLEEKLGMSVLIYNDCLLTGLGEAVYGAGKDERIVCYVTVSSGVNGVRIVDRAIDVNAAGFEIGHQIIDLRESRDLESYISGLSIERRYGKSPMDINDPKIWEEVERYLAVGVSNTILHWSPNILILGGGVMYQIDINHIIRNVNGLIGNFFEVPKIVKSKLGDFGGLWGGLYISRDH